MTTVKRWGYEVVPCEDGAQALELLRQKEAPKLVLLSSPLVKVNEIQVCREVRKFEHSSYRYLIVMGQRDRNGLLVEALRAGADDWIAAPFDQDELRARLQVGSRIVLLQRNYLAALCQSEFRAAHDPLTGLWNQAAIMDLLKREFDRSHRINSPLSLIMADVDLFKEVNDGNGHLVGDEVLREISRRIVSSVRSYDYVGRYGGDEFIIIMPGCDTESACIRAENLRASIVGLPVSTTLGDIRCTVSIGLAVTEIRGHSESRTFLEAADQSLYRAKRSGRNRVELSVDR